jgi:hypothetical protein
MKAERIPYEQQTMIGKRRYVNIRGDVRLVKVEAILQKDEYLVSQYHLNTWCAMVPSDRSEIVPGHLFYHTSPTGLVMRDQPEFKRKYPGHPIEVEHLPAL